MYELDALFLQRGGKKIVPVRVEGIANCDEVADRYPDKFTRERGCPELLWYADFKECDPEGWADKVALIPNFDQFRVQFKEDAKPGDILRVIRQAVRASDMNEEGQRCAASGNMNFHLGVIDSNGNMQYGSTPIAKGAHNTGDFHITDEHLQTNYVSPDEQYWPTSPDDETFGENVDHDPPEGW